MKTKLKIKLVKCPSCKGSGEFMAIEGSHCMWCKGEKKVKPSVAKHFAIQLWNIAGGGFINGDHDLIDMRAMEAEAESVYKFLGEKPPWKKAA